MLDPRAPAYIVKKNRGGGDMEHSALPSLRKEGTDEVV
jgi:hypothetical protein